MMFFAFILKKPHDLMIRSTSSCFAAASACGVGYAANRNGVVRLTRASVHCALRMTAISNVNGDSYSSAVTAAG